MSQESRDTQPESREFFRSDGDIIKEISDKLKDSWVTELADGRVDGTNKVFSATNAFAISTLMVFLNGVRKIENIHYKVLNERQIEFLTAPVTNDTVLLDYIPQEA